MPKRASFYTYSLPPDSRPFRISIFFSSLLQEVVLNLPPLPPPFLVPFVRTKGCFLFSPFFPRFFLMLATSDLLGNPWTREKLTQFPPSPSEMGPNREPLLFFFFLFWAGIEVFFVEAPSPGLFGCLGPGFCAFFARPGMGSFPPFFGAGRSSGPGFFLPRPRPAVIPRMRQQAFLPFFLFVTDEGNFPFGKPSLLPPFFS